MRLVVFGLAVSSAWGNGHATLWRGLSRALAADGHRLTFFERDVPYYARYRDLDLIPGCELILYPNWAQVIERARVALDACDAALVTSSCPDGLAATALTLASRAPRRIFYELDTPVTLDRIARGERVEYLGPDGLSGFDRVLSYTGGTALAELEVRLGARHVAPLYGSVDPEVHRVVPPELRFAASLSYLGTHATDRQVAFERLFVIPARRRPQLAFVVGGALYPPHRDWPRNLRHHEHVAPGAHAAFYCSSSLTLNLTRRAMAERGYCPSGRLFEAAACGVPVVSDRWAGLDQFFRPGEEILLADSTDEVLEALARPPQELQQIGRAARARVLSAHTARHRARELLALIDLGGVDHAGDRTGGGIGQPNSTIGLFKGAPARR
jgi:spore maturation protein CgeB